MRYGRYLIPLIFLSGLLSSPASASCIDQDGDGYGNPPDAACFGGPLTDCNDSDAGIHPGAPEVCDGIDNDCNDRWDTLCPPECTLADANCPFVRTLLGRMDAPDPSVPDHRLGGFAKGVIGGFGGQVRYVTSTDNSFDDQGRPHPGSLRWALDPEGDGPDNAAVWIRFRVGGAMSLAGCPTEFSEPNAEGTLGPLSCRLNTGSYKTIDGRGGDVRIVDYGLTIQGYPSPVDGPNWSQNVILENLTIHHTKCGKDAPTCHQVEPFATFCGPGNQNYCPLCRIDDGRCGCSCDSCCEGEDAVSIRRYADTIWVDHLTLEDAGDALLDVAGLAQDVTISWSRFHDHIQVSAIHCKNEECETPPRITFHHNYFGGTYRRHPRADTGRIHMYNNYLRNWQDWGVGINSKEGRSAQVLLHGNMFYTVEQGPSRSKGIVYGVDDDAVGSGKGRAPLTGPLANLFMGEAEPGQVENHPEDVFNPTDCDPDSPIQGHCYSFQVTAASGTVADCLRDHAGARPPGAVGPWECPLPPAPPPPGGGGGHPDPPPIVPQ